MAGTALTLARYVPGDSPLHRLDARVKLVAALLVATAAVAAPGAMPQGVVGALLVAAFVAARLPVRLILSALRGAAWILLFVVAANLGWGWVVAHHAAWGAGESALRTPLEFAALIGRLFNLIVLAVVVTATTVPVDAAEGLERLLRPLARVRVPIHELGTLLVLTLSFVPLFLREARALGDAHRVKMGRARWSLFDRARSVVPLTVPLFLAVVRRADELAIALDARCFVPGVRRSTYVASQFGRREAIALGLAGGVFVFCVRR